MVEKAPYTIIILFMTITQNSFRNILIGTTAIFFVVIGYGISPVSAEVAALEVTHVEAVRATALPGTTFENGLSWVFDVTVPHNETILKLKLTDLSDGTNSIAVAGNARFNSLQSLASIHATQGQVPVSITEAGVYSVAMNIDPLSDLAPQTEGRQIQLTVEVKIPESSPAGSYAMTYGMLTQAPDEDNDTVPPSIAFHADVTVNTDQEAGAIVTYEKPLASDDVSGATVVTCTPGSGALFPVGITTVTCHSSDSTGNGRSTTFKVTVVYVPTTTVDTTAPYISPIPDETREATGPLTEVVLVVPVATDNIDPNPVVTLVTPGTLINSLTVGAHTVTWKATDASGNEFTRSYTITITDTTKPTIILNGSADVTAVAGTYVDLGATASDLVEGNLTPLIQVSGLTNISTVGTHVLTYSVTDAHGNIATPVTRTVHITPDTNGSEDRIVYSTTAPTNQDVTATFIPAGPVVMMNNGGSLQHTFTYNGSFTFEFIDTQSNIRTIVATVNNIDKVAPVVTLLGPAERTIPIGGTNGGYIDERVTAYDDVDGEYNLNQIYMSVTSSIPNFNMLDIYTEGVYFISFWAIDSVGNESVHVIRKVRVGNPVEAYMITARAGAFGSISPEGVVVVTEGEDQTFTISSNDRQHRVSSVTVDGVALPGALPADPGGFDWTFSYTFSNVNTNHTIEAGFVRDYSFEQLFGNLTEVQDVADHAVVDPSPDLSERNYHYPDQATLDMYLPPMLTALQNAWTAYNNPASSRYDLFVVHGPLVDTFDDLTQRGSY